MKKRTKKEIAAGAKAIFWMITGWVTSVIFLGVALNDKEGTLMWSILIAPDTILLRLVDWYLL